MKCLKMVGLSALAAALMAFAAASTASAATLEDAGGVMEPGDNISMESSHIILHPPYGSITCAKTTLSGTINNAHGVSVNVNTLTFSSCNATFKVLKTGILFIDGNGIVSGAGQEITVEFFGTHCIYKTTTPKMSTTKLGLLTSSSKTKGHAVLDIEAELPREGGGSGIFCGESAPWTGIYTVTNPSTLNVLK